ncbi:hypothetical protein AGDE_01695 [Angomonas deanei]|uniref:Ribosome associated membrane protein RAMP4, putative n=1 Tax=Angomonas deanei TaxID=59799 RepID=A0A7G2CDV3_9TRYP|nr:hypothetical protein AGDE_01695 [Angomonas deanei]CAD2217137.1 Ribosome associated membrane protein RAMP4, putative [Angomonas deanei]|eukprot:EPY42228.1 hypothetical protein AGDE_01695 [Angomonas deanei]
MPHTPPSMKIRERAKHQPTRLSDKQKELLKEKRQKKQNAIPTWLIWFMMFVVVGSVFVQMYFSIVSSPSMSD